eukprot:CAMPEP_0184491152 /NCGR_PEP_ID=MMETSP0113_2-20130426/19717_1 /TAXON_ID=91329 /ORGANISM="Norrisiella sphaerica, Strain BC52" /LENGTH=568 /DNA_ID=CAMNT_0026875399 /DNA_START=96 /DNA_END=1803 /DNA_ORIENTATION=-
MAMAIIDEDAWAISLARTSFPSPLLTQSTRILTRPGLRLFSQNVGLRPAKKASGTIWRRTALAAALGLGAWGCIKYANELSSFLAANEEMDVDSPHVLVEPETFQHPYERKSWCYKVYVKTKRTLFLVVIFTPCAMLYSFAEWTASEEWREYWLKMLVQTVELSGCSVQKFAQWCSMRPDMFSPDVVEALSKLRCDAPPHEFQHTRKVIREAFGREIEDIFEKFEERPVASGTVAQVHRARLRKTYAIDGKVRDVAVKVQHPNVLEETYCDVDLLFHIVNMSETFKFPMKKDDFMMVLQRQTNFEWEAYNLRKFANNFRTEIKEGTIKFPDVSLDLLSPAVLVESWANGSTVSNFFSTLEEGITDVSEGLVSSAKQLSQSMVHVMEDTKKDLARKIFSMNMKMFLRDNLIHSDMHAGNLLFSAETAELTVLDAGQTASLRPDVAPVFGKFLHAICTRDREGVFKALVDFDEQKGGQVPDLNDFRKDVNIAMDKFCPEGEPIIVGDIMGQLFFALSKHKLIMRSDVSVSLMSMAVSEGLILQLDPDFDMVGAAMPYIAKYGTFNSAAHS